MREFIPDSYPESENVPWLRGSRYDLLSPRNEIIMPSYWGQVIQAGWVVKMAEHPRQEILIKDAVGRKYTLHWSHVRNWQYVTSNEVQQRLSSVNSFHITLDKTRPRRA